MLKTIKKQISSSVWSVQHPNAGQIDNMTPNYSNIHNFFFLQLKLHWPEHCQPDSSGSGAGILRWDSLPWHHSTQFQPDRGPWLSAAYRKRTAGCFGCYSPGLSNCLPSWIPSGSCHFYILHGLWGLCYWIYWNNCTWYYKGSFKTNCMTAQLLASKCSQTVE